MWWVRHTYNDDEAESDTTSSPRRPHEIVRTLQGRSLQFLKKNQHAVWVLLPSLPASLGCSHPMPELCSATTCGWGYRIPEVAWKSGERTPKMVPLHQKKFHRSCFEAKTHTRMVLRTYPAAVESLD